MLEGVTFFFFGTILHVGIILRHWGCCLAAGEEVWGLFWQGEERGLELHLHHFCASLAMRAFHSALFCVM